MRAITAYCLLIILLNLNHVKVFAQPSDRIKRAIEEARKEQEEILLTGTPQQKYEVAKREAESFNSREEYAKAIEMYTIAIENKPNNPDIYYSRASCKGELGDYRGAVADYTKALDLNPKPGESFAYTFAYQNRAHYKGMLKDYRGAIADYTKSLEVNPRWAAAYNGRGVSKAKLNDHREAILDFNKAIEQEPEYAEAHYNKGISLIKTGEKDSGCLELSRAGELGLEIAYKKIKEYCN